MNDWKNVLPKRIEEEIELKKDKDNNYNQKTMCQNIGISEATLSLLLKGERNPRIDTIIALAKELDVDVDYLIGITDFKKRPSNQKEIDIEQLCKLFYMNKKSIENLMKINGTLNSKVFDTLFGSEVLYSDLIWKILNYFVYDDIKSEGAFVVENSNIIETAEKDWEISARISGITEDFELNTDGKHTLEPKQYEELLLKDIGDSLKEMKKRSAFEIEHLQDKVKELDNEIKALQQEQEINEVTEKMIDECKNDKREYEEEIAMIKDYLRFCND